ncbi:MAG: hypothetical protein M3353_06010 [Actinomycetota bacterium]|nr:hypothetical protein [Actinomycetota bacterium]
MTEHDLHDPLRRLAETAPAPAPGLAGYVVERGRTARRRHLAAVTVAGAAVVAALVVLVPVLGSGSTDQGAEPPVVTNPTTTTEPPPPEPSARMKVAAAGVRELLREEYPSEKALLVRNGVCEQYRGDPNGCTDLTKMEMTDLERLLSAYSITWVDRSPRDLEGRLYVEISELKDVSADGGSVFAWALAGAHNCVGWAYDVTLRPDAAPVSTSDGIVVVC